jgi:hypothetical protein
MKKQRIPRGIRNNNPLNLRVGNNWKGEVSQPTDHTFEQFTEMKWGVRAAFIVLRNYIVRHKCNTIRKIIPRWAPANENNTRAYIATVSQRANIQPDEPISFDNTCQMIALLLAMCFVENGQEISLDDVVEGWLLANKR